MNKKMGVKFGWYYKMAYLCTALKQNAEIAQLVEHNLAKVRVASSSLVFRSTSKRPLRIERSFLVVDVLNCSGGGIGRHAGLKILWAEMSVRVRFPSRALFRRSCMLNV